MCTHEGDKYQTEDIDYRGKKRGGCREERSGREAESFHSCQECSMLYAKKILAEAKDKAHWPQTHITHSASIGALPLHNHNATESESCSHYRQPHNHSGRDTCGAHEVYSPSHHRETRNQEIVTIVTYIRTSVSTNFCPSKCTPWSLLFPTWQFGIKASQSYVHWVGPPRHTCFLAGKQAHKISPSSSITCMIFGYSLFVSQKLMVSLQHVPQLPH